MQGKTVLVTGASSGIGKEAALALAGMGATVVLGVRSVEKGEATRREIHERTKSADVHLLEVDLRSFASVRRAAAEYRRRFPRLDVLVNNAGLHTATRRLTEDGHEETWQVNHLSHFLLTMELLPLLTASAPSRVVNVASDSHILGRMNWSDLGYERGWRGGMAAYGQSKLANILFTRELARRLAGTGVTAYALHPGSVATGWGTVGSGLLRAATTVYRPFMRSARRGAETVVWLATEPGVERLSGGYFKDKRPHRSTKAARSEDDARRLWDASAAAVGARARDAQNPPSRVRFFE